MASGSCLPWSRSIKSAELSSAIRLASTLLTDTSGAVYSVKRLMGRGVEDVQEELKLFPFRLADGLKPGEVLKLNVAGLN